MNYFASDIPENWFVSDGETSTELYKEKKENSSCESYMRNEFFNKKPTESLVRFCDERGNWCKRYTCKYWDVIYEDGE